MFRVGGFARRPHGDERKRRRYEIEKRMNAFGDDAE